MQFYYSTNSSDDKLSPSTPWRRNSWILEESRSGECSIRPISLPTMMVMTLWMDHAPMDLSRVKLITGWKPGLGVSPFCYWIEVEQCTLVTANKHPRGISDFPSTTRPTTFRGSFVFTTASRLHRSIIDGISLSLSLSSAGTGTDRTLFSDPICTACLPFLLRSSFDRVCGWWQIYRCH